MLTKVTLALLGALILLVAGAFMDAQRESDYLQWRDAHNCVDITPDKMKCNGVEYSSAKPD